MYQRKARCKILLNKGHPIDTNLERWRYYLQDIESPELYITWGFYYLISSALQRRIWYGPETMRLRPNQFVILVGPPATGKGRIIKAINGMLKYHKWKPEKPENDNLLFPLAADSTTLEALTREMACSIRTCIVPGRFLKDGKTPLTVSHTSMAFTLEELSSLFRRDTDDLVKFLIQCWDSGDYTRKTKFSGVDEIRKVCLNMIAGTTPKFLQEAMADKLVGDGFTSRTIFVYAAGPRFRKFEVQLTTEQLSARLKILEHLKELSKLYGEVTFTPDALKFLTDWYENKFAQSRINQRASLDDYYERKKGHLIKLSIAIHFADNSKDYVVDIGSAKKALDLLDLTEENMHFALQNLGKNPLGTIMRGIITYIKRTGPKSFQDIVTEFQNEARSSDIKEVFQMLTVDTKQLVMVSGGKWGTAEQLERHDAGVKQTKEMLRDMLGVEKPKDSAT